MENIIALITLIVILEIIKYIKNNRPTVQGLSDYFLNNLFY